MVREGQPQVRGTDLYHLKDYCASCRTWDPRAEHEDTGRTFREDLSRQKYPYIPSLEYTFLSLIPLFRSFFGLRLLPPVREEEVNRA